MQPCCPTSARRCAVVASIERTARGAVHPFPAAMLAGSLSLFLCTLLADYAYWSTYQIEWANCGVVSAAWYSRPLPCCSRRRPVRQPSRAAVHAGAGGDLDPGLHKCAAPCARCMGGHAGGVGPVFRDRGAGLRGDLDRVLQPARGRSEMKRSDVSVVVAIALSALLAGCSGGNAPELDQYGARPQLPQPERGLFPNMTIAEPAVGTASGRACRRATRSPRSPPVWASGRRWCSNGDILVAEGRGGSAPG